MKKAKIVNLRNLKKRLKTVKTNPPKSKKVVKNLVKRIIEKLKKTVVAGEEFKKLQRKVKRLKILNKDAKAKNFYF